MFGASKRISSCFSFYLGNWSPSLSLRYSALSRISYWVE